MMQNAQWVVFHYYNRLRTTGTHEANFFLRQGRKIRDEGVYSDIHDRGADFSDAVSGKN
jgi:hypothetical protein